MSDTQAQAEDRRALEAKLTRIGNLVANLAHLKGDHRQNDLEDEAHDLLRELRSELSRLSRERDEWKDAIIDATVVDWIYTAEHETNPRKAVNDLLMWQSQLALNPAVSEEAAKLHAEISRLSRVEQALRHAATAVLRAWDDDDDVVSDSTFLELMEQLRTALSASPEAQSEVKR